MKSQPDDSAVFERGRLDPSFEKIAEAACARLAKNLRVRRNLPGGGRLKFDRQLPFLCIHRSPPGKTDPETRELVTTMAAYLFASGDQAYHQGLQLLCRRIVAAMQEHFGTFLLIEIWPQSELSYAYERTLPAPGFEIYSSDPETLPSTLEVFVESLSEVKIHGQSAEVALRQAEEIAPPGLPPLFQSEPEEWPLGCCPLGIAVRPIYRDPSSGHVFPVLLQRLRWQLAKSLRKGIAKFTGLDSGSKLVHYDALGPSALVKAVGIIDQELSEVAETFDFLLQVTPTNSDPAWNEFSQGQFKKAPILHYRPLPYQPSLLKRRLFDIEIERVEDPTLAHLFWEKQVEISRQLSALRDLDTPDFLPNSLQLYGKADDDLVALAKAILAHPPKPANRCEDETKCITAKDFVARAREEIDHYHQSMNSFSATVEVCDTIAAGVMVSQDRLLVAKSLELRPERVVPLLHHEIGTHLLTYFNGHCQPFRQLYAGLAGYEELQEGLAVLAEYLCGGLTCSRLRALAGRVMAVRSLTDGLSFPETFARLSEEFHFKPRQAFVTTLRVYRGGGLTKDVIYLRGFRNLHTHLAAGHDTEPLYVGKIGLQHLPYLQELRRRGIIDAPCLLPRFWDDSQLRDRLEEFRGQPFLNLLESCL